MVLADKKVNAQAEIVLFTWISVVCHIPRGRNADTKAENTLSEVREIKLDKRAERRCVVVGIRGIARKRTATIRLRKNCRRTGRPPRGAMFQAGLGIGGWRNRRDNDRRP